MPVFNIHRLTMSSSMVQQLTYQLIRGSYCHAHIENHNNSKHRSYRHAHIENHNSKRSYSVTSQLSMLLLLLLIDNIGPVIFYVAEMKWWLLLIFVTCRRFYFPPRPGGFGSLKQCWWLICPWAFPSLPRLSQYGPKLTFSTPVENLSQ